jgi:HK97 family phage major capsid protein
MNHPEEIRAELREIERRRAKCLVEVENLHSRQRAAPDDDGLTERVSRINSAVENLDSQKAELEGQLAEIQRRQERAEEIVRRGNPGNFESTTDPFQPHRPGEDPSSGTRQQQQANPVLDGALRTIERHKNDNVLRSEAADTLDALVRGPDSRRGLDAAYLEAVGDPHYFDAFGKMIVDPVHGHLRFTPQEVAAVQRVTQAETMRAMSIGTGSAGGFGVPFTLDPSILLTSSGVLNPIRTVARVITVSTDQWKGVSSTGVTASYDPEAQEVSDDTPTLAQPVIDCAMGRAFIPFSIELGMDWGGLQQELTRLISDGRDVLDATQFLTGTGTDSPAGVLTGLTTSQRIQDAAAGFPAVADHYSLKGAVPARFLANLTWAAHQSQWDRTYRLTPVGSTTEPQMLTSREGAMLGRPKIEWSTMANVSTAGSKLIIAGDFQAAFTIADRVGMSVEIIPHLFGATNRFPTGQRGLFCFWRTGSKVVVPEALRYLETI